MKRTFADHSAATDAAAEEEEKSQQAGIDERAGGRPKAAAAQKSAKRLRTVSLLSLEPFAFFVRAPPVAYAQHYCQLADHMEGLINEDFAVGERPFAAALHCPDDGAGPAMAPWFAAEGGTTWLDGDSKLFFREQWKDIEAVINDAHQTQVTRPHTRCFVLVVRFAELWWCRTAGGS